MSIRQSMEERDKELSFKADLDSKVKARQAAIENEVVENVLIKEAKGRGDRVFVVNRLPKTLLFRAARELAPLGQHQQKQPTGEVTDELLPGIERSKTGDNGYVFFPRNQEAKQRLETIDNYIRSKWPSNRPLPKREFYCYQPGNPMSPPRPLSMVLRVELPTSPPAEQSAASEAPSITKNQLDAIKAMVREELLEQQKAENAAKMAKVRAAKEAKKNKE